MPFVKTRDHVDLYVKDWGSGRPVILLHGWPLTADMWDYHAMRLAEAGHRVIFYDRRGFGRSEQPFSGYDYDTLADDLAQVIEQTGAQDATLVGFSMGGGEVARYLSRHDGRNVVKAGLISSVVPYMLKDASNPHGVDASVLEEQIKAPIADERPATLAKIAQQFYGVGMISSPVAQETLEDFVRQGMMASLKATLDCVDAFGRTDFRPDLPAFRVPTLIVHGTSDKTVPIETSGRAAANAISGSTLITYDGAPHGLSLTEQERLADDLLSFVRS